LGPGEVLLWWGVPAPRRFLSEIIAHVIFGLIPFFFATVFLGIMVWQIIVKNQIQWAMLPGYLIGALAGIGFLAIGIGCFMYPLKMRSRLREVVYAVTDLRAIVLTSPKSFWNPVPARITGESSTLFTTDQMRQYQKKWRDFGRTDLIFVKEWRKASRGGSWHYFGFLGLDDPGEPERIIKEFHMEVPANQKA
jgi:hypothetical protein